MKKILLLGYLIPWVVGTYAQLSSTGRQKLNYTLHAYLFCNTNDSKIGLPCTYDYCRMSNEIERIAEGANLRLSMHYFIGQDFNERNIDSTIKNLTFNIGDVVILYFSSHGARDSLDKSSFPRLSVPGQSSMKYVSTESIHNRVKAKIIPNSGNYLIITIIDACNIIYPLKQNDIINYTKIKYCTEKFGPGSNEVKDYFNSNVEYVPLIFQTSEVYRYKKLFRETVGDIIITSSKPGEYSYADTSNSTSTGSLFTNAFILELNNAVNGTIGSNWTDIFATSQEQIKQKEQKQHPIWQQSMNLLRLQYDKYDIEQIRSSISYKFERQNEKGSTKTIAAHINFFDPPEKRLAYGSELEGAMFHNIDTIFYTIFSKSSEGHYIIQNRLYSCSPEDKFSVTFRQKEDFLIQEKIKLKSGGHFFIKLMQSDPK